MLFVAEVAKNKRYKITEDENLLFGIDRLKIIRSLIPAITHVDYTARIQTVDKFTNPLYYALISKFKERRDVRSLSTHPLTFVANL